jgi:hypothetical protein
MIKVIMLMKRRPGMTTEAFRDYYESKHRLIGEKYLRGFATRYVRRYVNPLPDRSGELYDPEYDVVLEVWYPDETTFKDCAENLQNPEIAKEINDDEQQVFDMRFMRSYVVEEYESRLD